MIDRQVEQFESSTGARIFRIPLQVFPDYAAYAHLILSAGHLTLVDVGSGFGTSTADLLAGLEFIEQSWGVACQPAAIDQIIVTHGHIDHFGGLPSVVRVAPNAQVMCHELASPVLSNYSERRLLTSAGFEDFLKRAGVPDDRLTWMLDMYDLGKGSYTSMPVDRRLRDGDQVDGMQVIHVPGHAPGLIMLRLGDVLLTADHVLPHTSVALWPESIMPYTGVGHYVESLERALGLEGVRLALGGHEEPMLNYYEVTQNTLTSSLQKVQLVQGHCSEPSTAYEVALRIYGKLDGYSAILKVSQTGARIEYLNQRGLLEIANLGDMEHSHTPALRYRAKN